MRILPPRGTHRARHRASVSATAYIEVLDMEVKPYIKNIAQ